MEQQLSEKESIIIGFRIPIASFMQIADDNWFLHGSREAQIEFIEQYIRNKRGNIIIAYDDEYVYYGILMIFGGNSLDEYIITVNQRLRDLENIYGHFNIDKIHRVYSIVPHDKNPRSVSSYTIRIKSMVPRLFHSYVKGEIWKNFSNIEIPRFQSTGIKNPYIRLPAGIIYEIKYLPYSEMTLDEYFELLNGSIVAVVQDLHYIYNIPTDIPLEYTLSVTRNRS